MAVIGVTTLMFAADPVGVFVRNSSGVRERPLSNVKAQTVEAQQSVSDANAKPVVASLTLDRVEAFLAARTTRASIPAMSIRWHRDRLPIAVFADAEMFLAAFWTDRTGHLILAAEIGGNPTLFDHHFEIAGHSLVAKCAIHFDWSFW
jgi:hypothetical protein